jgi:hypothetical protein
MSTATCTASGRKRSNLPEAEYYLNENDRRLVPLTGASLFISL